MADVAAHSSREPEAVRDPLTGAYARTILPRRLAEEISRVERYGGELTLCLLDLDFFKSINDAYGHSRGDQVLLEFAGRVHAMIRRSDLFFRYGGDEFVLLLPSTPKQQAMTIVERVIMAVRGGPFSGDPPLTLSLSVGVACFPEDAASAEALFEVADRRSYEAKRRGRAQAVSYDESESFHLPPFEMLSRLIERDSQLEQLYNFLSQLHDHPRGVLRICGAVGSGRTRFLKKAIEAARLQQYAVLSFHGHLNAQEEPEAAVAELDLPIELPLAAGGEALSWALREAMASRQQDTLLIAVDDLDRVDYTTLSLILQLLEAGTLEHVGLIYTSPPGKIKSPPESSAQLFALVELQPLSLEGLHIWLRLLLQWEPPPALLDWLQVQTGGMPALAQKLLTFLIERQLLQRAGERSWLLHPDYQSQAAEALSARRREPPPHNLPTILTEFVGREREVQQIVHLLSNNQLVTLVGPGGIGKTRLSLQVASEALEHFAHGAFFVALGLVSDPSLVSFTIAQTLGVSKWDSASFTESLKLFLASKQMLLVLDNFEQVISSAPLIGELLQAAPDLKLLVTSREILHLYGERQFQVPPLQLPSLERLPPLDQLVQYECVRLFLERAQAVNPSIVLNRGNAQTIVEICHRLDGLPLAIELAAARVRLFTPEELLARLNKRLKVLSSPLRDLPQRQQTMRSAIEWSYKLLTAHEQLLFRRLGVFVGGGTIRAVETICNADHQIDLLGVLQPLVDKSLVRADNPEGDMRYSLLDTIREYALERLEEHGEAPDLQRRHAEYYVDYAERYGPLVMGAQQMAWLRTLKREFGNLREAIEYLIAQRQVDSLVRIYQGMWRFLWAYTQSSEVLRWSERLLELSESGAPANRAKALLFNGGLLRLSSTELPEARARLEQCLDLARGLDQPWVMLEVLYHLGMAKTEEGNNDLARELYSEGLALSRATPGSPLINDYLTGMGIIALRQGDSASARQLFEESLTLAQQGNHTMQIAYATAALAWSARYEQHYRQARELLEKALLLFRELGDSCNTMGTLSDLGSVALCQGDVAQARVYLEESLRLYYERNNKYGILLAIERLGEVAESEGAPLRAARLWGAVSALRKIYGLFPLPDELERHALAFERARQALGEPRWRDAWSLGQLMSLDDALAFALS